MTRKKLWIGAAVVWAVLVGGGYAVFLGVAMFNYTSLDMVSNSDGPHRTEEFRWNGEPILIDGKQRKRVFASCRVVPDEGETRELNTRYYTGKKGNGGSLRRETTTSWFSGSATMTCNEPVNVYAGTGYSMYMWATNLAVQIGVAVVAGVPLVLTGALGSGLVGIRR